MKCSAARAAIGARVAAPRRVRAVLTGGQQAPPPLRKSGWPGSAPHAMGRLATVVWQRRWLAASEHGAAAVQATRDLETVTALFDITDHYVSRTRVRPCADSSSTSPRCSCRLCDLNRQPRQSRSWSQRTCRAGTEMGSGSYRRPTGRLRPNTVPRGGVFGNPAAAGSNLDGVTKRCLDARAVAGPRSAGLLRPRWVYPAAAAATAVDSDAGGRARGGA